jgi:hypothetical protein
MQGKILARSIFSNKRGTICQELQWVAVYLLSVAAKPVIRNVRVNRHCPSSESFLSLSLSLFTPKPKALEESHGPNSDVNYSFSRSYRRPRQFHFPSRFPFPSALSGVGPPVSAPPRRPTPPAYRAPLVRPRKVARDGRRQRTKVVNVDDAWITTRSLDGPRARRPPPLVLSPFPHPFSSSFSFFFFFPLFHANGRRDSAAMPPSIASANPFTRFIEITPRAAFFLSFYLGLPFL